RLARQKRPDTSAQPESLFLDRVKWLTVGPTSNKLVALSLACLPSFAFGTGKKLRSFDVSLMFLHAQIGLWAPLVCHLAERSVFAANQIAGAALEQPVVLTGARIAGAFVAVINGKRLHQSDSSSLLFGSKTAFLISARASARSAKVLANALRASASV